MGQERSLPIACIKSACFAGVRLFRVCRPRKPRARRRGFLGSAPSMSIDPLKRQPSSSVTLGAEMLPRTLPEPVTMICSLPRRSPSTVPSILMTFASTVALTRPSLPMVTRWFFNEMLPSTVPRTSRSSSPLMSPWMRTDGPTAAPPPPPVRVWPERRNRLSGSGVRGGSPAIHWIRSVRFSV